MVSDFLKDKNRQSGPEKSFTAFPRHSSTEKTKQKTKGKNDLFKDFICFGLSQVTSHQEVEFESTAG